MLAAALVFAGCGPNVRPRAAGTLACKEDEIRFDSNVGVATGCGRTDALHYDFPTASWSSLRERAAFDMTCDRNALVVTVIDQDTFGVVGCGHKATYKHNRNGFVMDSSSDLSPKPAASTM